MGLWLVTLAVVVAIAAIGTVIARRRQPEAPPRSLGSLVLGRLVVIVMVTALVAITRIEVGALAAAVIGCVGIVVGIVLLIRTGYAGSIFPSK